MFEFESRRKTTFILGGLCLLVSIALSVVCGCGSEQSVTPISVIVDNQTGKNDASPEAVSFADIEVGHITGKYSEKYFADAIVTNAPQSPVDVLSVQLKRFDEQQIIDTFFSGASPNRRQDDGSVYFSTEDGSDLSCCDGSIYYRHADERYIKFPTENLSGGKYHATHALPWLGVYYKQECLDFMPPDEAVSYVKEVLKRFSIRVADNVELYAVDHASMQAYQDEMTVKQADSVGFYSIKDTFTKDDEFYVLCFDVIENQIPLTHYTYVPSATGMETPSTGIVVYLSKRGIIKLTAEGIYDIKGAVRTEKSFISPEDAVSSAGERYSRFEYADKVTAREVSFEYSPIPSGRAREFSLIPSWVITAEFTTIYDDVEQAAIDYETLAVDAVTGELLM